MGSKCPKCGGEMEEGFIAEYILKDVKKSKWASVIKTQALGFVDKLENEREILSLRCINCGYLEDYAK